MDQVNGEGRWIRSKVVRICGACQLNNKNARWMGCSQEQFFFSLLLRLCVEYQYKNQTGYVEDVYNYSQLNNRWKVFIFQ